MEAEILKANFDLSNFDKYINVFTIKQEYHVCLLLGFLISFLYLFIDVCNFETDGDFAHKTDCDKYYTCKEGIPTPKKCAPGQFFSRTSRQCDSYENVDCVVNDEGGKCTIIM